MELSCNRAHMTSLVFTHSNRSNSSFTRTYTHTIQPISLQTSPNLQAHQIHQTFNRHPTTSTMASRCLRLFTRTPISRATATTRTFTTSPFLRIKEDADRTPEQVEAAKQDQLREQKEGKGRWREDLASHGESNIAADKQNVEDHGEHMEELQKEGKEKGEKGEL
jgi:hypothetical protein